MSSRAAFRLLPYALGLAAFAAYALLSIVRFRRFDTPSWDNAIFEQAIAGYASLGAPIVDIKGPGFNVLGDHFSPAIALVAPLYRLFPAAQTLLVVQAALIALTVVILARVAMVRLGAAPGVALGVAYALSFGIQSAVQADFHEVALAVPLLTMAGGAYLRRDWGRVVWWTVPLLLVKEDLGLTVAAVGGVLWLCGQRRRGVALAAGGLVAMAMILFVVIPAFNPTGSYDYFANVQDAGSSSAAPLAGWELKGPFLAALLGITGFAALRSPWLLVVVPTLVWRFAGDNEFYWGTDFHYSLVLMPVVFVALIDAVERSRTGGPAWFASYAKVAPYAGLLVVLAMSSSWPLAQLLEPESYEPSPREASAEALMSLIDEEATVATDVGLITHLTTDHQVFWVGTLGPEVPDYVLIDAERGGWSPAAPDAAAYGQEAFDVPYTTVFDQDGYTLARRR